jgi:hypothetical protein
MTFDQIWELAGYAAKSRMFGVETSEQAFCLMMICQAKGLHPIDAMTRYYVVKGRPTMRSDIIQAEFQARGGVIKILDRTATKARALFSHPVYQPEPVEFTFGIEDARRAKLTSPDGNYEKYPATMLWWRLVSMAIRAIYPGITSGIYSTEEIEQMTEAETPAAQITASKEAARSAVASAVASADEPVPGHDPRQPDTRPYVLMANEAVAATNQLVTENWGDLPNPPAPMDARRLHGVLALKAVNMDKADGPAPTKVQQAVAFVSKVYGVDRQWVRCEVRLACQTHAEVAAEALEVLRESQEEPAVVDAPAGRESGEDDADPDVDLPY